MLSARHYAWRFLWHKPAQTLLQVLLFALGVATMVLMIQVQHHVSQHFARNLQGIDAVVGAKGSPLQLILSGVFHIDRPTGNILLTDLARLRAHPLVKQAIPLSLGDNYRGLRIVGTEQAYAQLYGGRLQAGRWFASGVQGRTGLEAVVGANAAQRSGLGLGAQFVGTHGLEDSGHAHEDQPMTVVGVLAPCGCVLDGLILTTLEAVWAVHEDGVTAADLSAEDRAAIELEREVTLALIQYKSPVAAVQLPRWVNQETVMQAASPADEVQRLWVMLGFGVQAVVGLGVGLLVLATVALLVGLWSALQERQKDLALLRMLGAPPLRLAYLVFLQALLLVVLATFMGLLLGQGLTALLLWLAGQQNMVGVLGSGWVAALTWPPEQWLLLALVGLLALLGAALPAWQAYRTQVFTLLKNS